MRKFSLIIFLILLINSAYLFSFGEPTLFYIFNVLFHVGLGVVLIIPFSIYTYQYLRRNLASRYSEKANFNTRTSRQYWNNRWHHQRRLSDDCRCDNPVSVATHHAHRQRKRGEHPSLRSPIKRQRTPHATLQKNYHWRVGCCATFPDNRESYTTLSAE